MKKSNQTIWWVSRESGPYRARRYHRTVTNIEDKMFGRTGQVTIKGKVHDVRQDIHKVNLDDWEFMNDLEEAP